MKKKTKKKTKKSFKTKSKKSSGHVVDLILQDHKPLKVLIETLKDGEAELRDRKSAFQEFVPLLLSHAKSEEKSLYVAIKDVEDLRMEGFEGDTEHAIADELVQEIHRTADEDEWSAKVKVLAELVEHHIEEEEGEMLPEVRKQLDKETCNEIGNQYLQFKSEFDELVDTQPRKNKRNQEQRLHH